nr:MAG TPA: hypothetical protein [Caudoviricetes sp.]
MVAPLVGIGQLGESTRQPHLGLGQVGGVCCWLGPIDSRSSACAAGLGIAAKVECHKTITAMAINLPKGIKRPLATSGEVAMIGAQLTLSAGLSLMLLVFLGA